MKQFQIAVLPGDGIGPEVMDAAFRVLRALERNGSYAFEFAEAYVGGAAFERFGTHLPEDSLTLCAQSDAILFGSVGGPINESHLPKWKNCEINSILALRKRFEFGVNLRPVRVIPSLIERSPLKAELSGGVDILFVRELLGDLYFGERTRAGEKPFRIAGDTGTYTEAQCEAAIHGAFKAALKRRSKVTLVHKANVLTMSKLWVEIGREIAPLYPTIKYEEMLVDNCAMQLIIKPDQFDVVVTANLFGDILSDLGAAIPGTLGLSASASLNRSGFGLYEPAGGSAPDIAGRGIANPAAQILSAALLLEHSFDLTKEAMMIRLAIDKTYEQGVRTADLGGAASTEEFTDAVIRNL